MYTAQHAREDLADDYPELDARIAQAVAEAKRWGGTTAEIRVSIDDPWFKTIGEELERRGFCCIHVPDMCLKGDVEFSW